MANNWTGQNEHMSNTVRAIHESISSFITEQVQPILDSWEKDINSLMRSKPNAEEDQRTMLLTIVSQMVEQIKQLQATLGVGVKTIGYKELTNNTSAFEQMLAMIQEWKKDCKHIENHSVKHNENPDQTKGVATLISKIHGQLLYLMNSFTPDETGQERVTFVAQFGGTDGRQQQQHRTVLRPPQHRSPNGTTTDERQPRHRHAIIPLTTDRQLPQNRHPPNISLTTNGRQPQHNPPNEPLIKDERQKLIDESSNLQMKYDSMVAQNVEYKKKESQYAADMDKLKRDMERQKEELNKQVMANRQVAREKDEALNRLSEISGQKLRQNNPAITDLSTENRPTKIAERFKELYCNQWTEAFTELTDNGCSEIKAIDILFDSLEGSFCSTASISKRQMKQLEHSAQMLAYIENTDIPEVARQTRQVDKAKTFHIQRNVSTPSRNRDKMPSQSEHTGDKMQSVPLSSECEDLLRQVLKASAPALVPEVQQSFLKEKRANVNFPEKNGHIAMTEFYKECAAITWFMNVQTPPLSLAPKPATGTPVQTDLYSLYTQSGEKVDYVVWPACLLHANGPLLTKGIVQPFKTERRRGVKQEKSFER